jgi:hypothetical protein
MPTAWGDRVAFARTYEGRRGRRGRLTYVYSRPLAGGRARRERGGPHGVRGVGGPLALDMQAGRLALTWEWLRKAADPEEPADSLVEVRVNGSGGGQSLVERQQQTESPTIRVTNASLDGDELSLGLVIATRYEGRRGEIVLHDLPSGRRDTLAAPGELDWVAADGAAVLFTTDTYRFDLDRCDTSGIPGTPPPPGCTLFRRTR